jgi:hypothetical protein
MTAFRLDPYAAVGRANTWIDGNSPHSGSAVTVNNYTEHGRLFAIGKTAYRPGP